MGGQAVNIDDGTPPPFRPSKFRKKLDKSSASEGGQDRR